MSVLFDGTNDLVNLASPAGLDNIWAGGATLMAWINLVGYGETGFGRIADKASDTNADDGWGFQVDGGSQRLRFEHGWSTTNGDWGSPASSILTAQWHHVAVSYDKGSTANDAIFVIDGALVAVTELTAPVGTVVDDAAQEYTIGNLDSSSTIRAFDGRQADMRVYDRILSVAEIASICNARGSDGIVQGLVSRWPMNDSVIVSPGSLYVAGSTDVVGAATSVVVGVPPEVRDGDELVLVVASSGDGTGTAENITTPAGWTLRNAGNTDLPATISTPSIWIFTRTASSEPADYTVTGDQTSTKIGYIMNFHGATGFDAISTINTGTSTSPVSPGVTAGADAIVLHIMCADDNDIIIDSSDTYPPSINGRKAFAFTGSGNGVSSGVATEMRDSGGTGTATWTLQASEQWGCLSMTLLGGGGAVPSYLKDVGPSQFPSIIQSAPLFAEDELRMRKALIGG